MLTRARPRALWPRLATIMLWASSRVVLLFAVYENAVHPFECSALCASNFTFLVLGATLLALPASLCLPIAALTGWRYVRGTVSVGWRWPTAWWSATAAAILTELWLIWSAVNEVRLPTGIGLPRAGDRGPLELLAAFVVAAAAMVAVLVSASHASRRPA